MPILAILLTQPWGWFKPQSQEGRPTKPRGLVIDNKGAGTWDAKGRFYGWDHGDGHVGL